MSFSYLIVVEIFIVINVLNLETKCVNYLNVKYAILEYVMSVKIQFNIIHALFAKFIFVQIVLKKTSFFY